MKIVVAGAGAGKTTEMAETISKITAVKGKRIYCLAFTNSAVAHIKLKLEDCFTVIPSNYVISTLHSFLYEELINPYYYLLYGQQFRQISTAELPNDPVYKNRKVKDFESKDILHVTVIPERAKWVIYRKSSDHQREKLIRNKIVKYFLSYCQSIYVDEAQDIDENMQQCLEALGEAGVNITLYGDPKQDVKGYRCFRKLIDNGKNSVEYRTVCHRCPQRHLDISNRLVRENEVQFAASENNIGDLKVVFETEIVPEGDNEKRCKLISELIDKQSFGLEYISKKQGVFLTHVQENKREFENLYQILKDIWKEYHPLNSELKIHRRAFYTAERMIERFGNGESVQCIIKSFIKAAKIDSLSSKQFAELAEAIKATAKKKNDNGIIVNSIEAVKGQEAENCLFILTIDLVPYLIGKKTEETKTKNLLYVALTRSLNQLTVFIPKNVESKYSKKIISSSLEVK